MKHIIDKNNFYIGFAGSKTELIDGQNEVPFAPSKEFVKAKWNGTLYVEGATEEEIIAVREVPNEVALWCIKAILHELGLLTTVEAEMTKLDEPMKTRANYIWNYGNIIKRDSLTVAFIGQVLQKSETEIDDIFINANNMEL